MIGSMDTLTGTPCEFCDRPIVTSWALHEVAPDRWVVICGDCELTTEIGEGK